MVPSTGSSCMIRRSSEVAAANSLQHTQDSSASVSTRDFTHQVSSSQRQQLHPSPPPRSHQQQQPQNLPPSSNPWAYPPATTSGKDARRNNHTQRQPTSMIGPTSTFYDPDALSRPQEANAIQNYQQWIESYEHSQLPQTHQHQQPQPQQPTHHRQQQMDFHTLPAGQTFGSENQLRNQFNFITGPYAPPSISRYPGSVGSSGAGTATQHNVNGNVGVGMGSVSLQNAVPYTQQQHQQQPQQQHSDMYFYDPIITDSNQTHPHYAQPQPQQPRPTYSPSDVGSNYGSLPISSPLSLPPSNPHSRSSLSPSYTEDPMSTTATSGTSGGGARGTGAKGKRGLKSQSTAKPTSSSNATPKGNASKRKRPRWSEERDQKERDRESDSGSEDEGYMMAVGISVGGVSSSGGRLPGACVHCKKLKMKCDFPKGDNTCKRCKSGGHVCIVEGRKPRTAPNKREYLLAQIRQKDAIIESLLKQLHNPYIATPMSIASYRMATSPSDQNNRNILAWLDRLQSSVRTAGGKAGPGAFKLDARARGDGNDEESEPETNPTLTHAQRYGLSGADGDAGTDGDEDGTIQDADEKLQQSSLPDSFVPLGLIANLSLSNNKSKNGGRKDQEAASEENLDDDNVGVANETYFLPGPATDLDKRAVLIEQHSPPEILVHGLVTPEDVEKLFDIFYTHVNPFVSLLDPVLHTPALTFARCPFLFTVICAISSRYYAEKSEIYPIAMHFAKHSAASALIDGWKSVELCQAYILMSIYAVPARRWEEDRSWLYTGLAIRIATDLNLHQVTTAKPQNEKHEREVLNRTRVWMICFNLDRSTATQFGKPSTIKEDHILRNSKDWYKKSKYNHPYDLHLCAHSALLRIVARFHDEIFSDPDSPTGLNKQVDFRAVTATHDARLTRYYDEWSKRFAQDSDPNDQSCRFRCTLLPFLVEYSRLVMYSFGFQQAYQRGIEPGDQVFFTKCLDAAKSVIRNMTEDLAPSGYMRYAPDGHFVFASFASAFLLKLLRPEFSHLLSKDQENEIFDLIGRLIQTLSSPDIAIDDRHTPKLYARFLAGLLSRHRRDGATVGRLHPQPPPPAQVPRSSSEFAHQAPPSSSTSSTFSVSQTQGGGGQTGGYTHNTFTSMPEKAGTPIYRPEATYAVGAGAIQFGGDLELLGLGSENGVSDEELLATMQALRNPAWWQTMMMPGFSWPEAQASTPSPAMNSTPAPYHQNGNIPGLHAGFGMFHAAQVPLH